MNYFTFCASDLRATTCNYQSIIQSFDRLGCRPAFSSNHHSFQPGLYTLARFASSYYNRLSACFKLFPRCTSHDSESSPFNNFRIASTGSSSCRLDISSPLPLLFLFLFHFLFILFFFLSSVQQLYILLYSVDR